MRSFYRLPIYLGTSWLCALCAPAWAADDTKTVVGPPEPTLEQELTPKIKKNPHRNIVNVVYENDMIGGGEDEYYTSGVRISYLDLEAKFPEFARDLDDLLPMISLNDTSGIFYSLGQNIFTPQDISSRTADPKDRPWAGYLYGSVGMVSLNDDHVDELEVSLGVVGPAAMGEQVQKFIHTHVTDSPVPKGWSNQLKNEPALTLGWQRSWRSRTLLDSGELALSFSPYAGATVGNVYDFINGGISLRLAPSEAQWQDTPVRVRPALPGTGYFDTPENKWGWYLFGGIEGRAIGRNIFLDGNTFTDSPSVDKENFVADANAGLALTYDQVRISYTLVYRTKEFEDQKDDTLFGAMSVGYRF